MLDSWEEMQAAWTSTSLAKARSAGSTIPDYKELKKMARKSIWRSYGISVSILAACVILIWELSLIALPQFTLLKIIVIGLGAGLIALWRIYLHLAFARSVSTSNLVYQDYLVRRAHLRKRAATASLASVLFMAGVLLLLAVPELLEQSFTEFFTIKRTIGLSAISSILVALGFKAQHSRMLAQKELISLSSIGVESALIDRENIRL